MKAIIYLNKILTLTKKWGKKLKIYHQINKENMFKEKTIIIILKKASNDFLNSK